MFTIYKGAIVMAALEAQMRMDDLTDSIKSAFFSDCMLENSNILGSAGSLGRVDLNHRMEV